MGPPLREAIAPPQSFVQGDWRNAEGTVVNNCDGRFAWAHQARTDYYLAFQFDDQRWQRFPIAGTTKAGLTRGCYNGAELKNRGATDRFLCMIPVCRPDEIGYRPW